MFALSLVLAAQAAAPSAVKPPVWSWPSGQPVRYHLETELLMPRGVYMKTSANTDARARAAHLTIDTECVATPVGKNLEVTCTFAWIGFKAEPYLPSETEGVARVNEEWSASMKPAKVEMFIGGDGHLREFDIQGMRADNARQRTIQEDQRIYLLRAFSVFDLPLSTEPDDWKRGWDQKGTTFIWNLVTQKGTVAVGTLTHKPIGEADGLYSINTSGRAMVASGDSIDAGGARNVEINAVGSTQIDVQKGLVAWRDLTLDGRVTVSNAEVGSDVEFGQVTALQLVDSFLPDGEAPPPLAATRAPRIENPPPDLPAGVKLVPYGELGMQALFVPEMPPAGKAQQFPTTHVFARVFVGADGVPTSVVAYKGYAALIEHAQQALRGARFPARAEAYAVDVDVEYRSEY